MHSKTGMHLSPQLSASTAERKATAAAWQPRSLHAKQHSHVGFFRQLHAKQAPLKHQKPAGTVKLFRQRKTSGAAAASAAAAAPAPRPQSPQLLLHTRQEAVKVPMRSSAGAAALPPEQIAAQQWHNAPAMLAQQAAAAAAPAQSHWPAPHPGLHLQARKLATELMLRKHAQQHVQQQQRQQQQEREQQELHRQQLRQKLRQQRLREQLQQQQRREQELRTLLMLLEQPRTGAAPAFSEQACSSDGSETSNGSSQFAGAVLNSTPSPVLITTQAVPQRVLQPNAQQLQAEVLRALCQSRLQQQAAAVNLSAGSSWHSDLGSAATLNMPYVPAAAAAAASGRFSGVGCTSELAPARAAAASPLAAATASAAGYAAAPAAAAVSLPAAGAESATGRLLSLLEVINVLAR
jgi:hypothetical protein